ncbi:MAG TPA: ATP-binding protein [Bdellovibrionota bacterium]|nr:ATP-binding protein [Bdellovibrionota bacterium]
MNSRSRYPEKQIRRDLASKMVFLGGPRQVGKTTLALRFLQKGSVRHPAYLSWDDPHARENIMRGTLPSNEPLVIFDEVHKFARWRNLLKGLFDTNRGLRQFLVTGSARLDLYRRGGDSLQGRYHYHRLHPFSLNEMNPKSSPSDLKDLLTFGGFPEPLFKGNFTEWRRWQRERRTRVVRDDLRDLERVRELSLIELLLSALPARVGSPLSIKSLAEDLQVAHDTVDRWLDILERLYVCYRISPYGSPQIRAVKKERKLYFWDWSETPEGGPRLENLVASHLLKFCHFKEDTEGFDMELRYLRDIDKREVDFVVLQDRKPLFAVECKSGEREISSAIRYFQQRVSIPRFFQVHLGDRDFEDSSGRIRVLPFLKFCREMELP